MRFLSPKTHHNIGIKIAIKYQDQGGKTIREFKAFTEKNDDFKKDIGQLAEAVENFASKFEIPGNAEY